MKKRTAKKVMKHLIVAMVCRGEDFREELGVALLNCYSPEMSLKAMKKFPDNEHSIRWKNEPHYVKDKKSE